MKSIVLVLTLLALMQGCSTTAVYEKGRSDVKVINSEFEPGSALNLKVAYYALGRRSENACQGDYRKVREWRSPGDDFGYAKVYWEIECQVESRILI